MSLYLEHKYVALISHRLRNFKRKGPNLYNFSCDLCGDSHSNKFKARGFIYEKNGKLTYYCHNCSCIMSVEKFIKLLDENLFNEFQMEKLQDLKKPEQLDFEQFIKKMAKPQFMINSPLSGLKKISTLPIYDPVKKFVDRRKIPTIYHYKLFSCPNFMRYTNSLLPDKFKEDSFKYDETRLLIPFINKEGKVHAYTGRSISNKSERRYIAILLDDSIPNVYGLDTVDFGRKYYCFEGPIDSMFIPNSIAAGGGDLVSSLKTFNKSNVVIVHDNEPRNKEIVDKIRKSIMNGYNVCIWPDNIDKKDVNDMILSGLSPEYIQYIIDQNTVKDLTAMLRFNSWKKC